MKLVLTFLKAIMLWATAVLVVLSIMIFSQMVEDYNWEGIIIDVILCLVMCFACKVLLTAKDIYKLSGTYYFDKLLK